MIKVSNHAKIRWYERFINSGNIDGSMIASEIKNNFKTANFIKKQQDNTSIYKSKRAIFIVDDINENEKFIITVYPVSFIIEDFDNNSNIKKEIKTATIERQESFELQVYKKVLNGDLDRFPPNFWQADIGGNDYVASRECTQYMFKKAEWSLGDILIKSSKNLFKEYKLNGMLLVLFQKSWQMAVYNAYPEIKPYMLEGGGVVRVYWEEDGIEKAKEMGKWLIQELNHDGYKFTPKNILSLRWDRIFKKYKLQIVLSSVFNNNLVDFFNIVFGSNLTEEDLIRYEMANAKYTFEKLHV